jgi:hypothetical protein
MEPTNYTNKMLDLETVTKTVKKKSKAKKGDTVFISPTSNQYVVSAEKLEQFKEVMKVDKSWTIK